MIGEGIRQDKRCLCNLHTNTVFEVWFLARSKDNGDGAKTACD